MLAGKAAAHDVLGNTVIRSLSAMHGLSHRLTGISQVLTCQLTRGSTVSRVLVAQRPLTDRQIAIRVVMDRRRPIVKVLTRAQMRAEHRHTPRGIRCMGRTLPRWHREWEWNLHITTSVTNECSEITPNLAHVKRPALCYRNLAHLDETTLTTNSEVIVTLTQRSIGFDVETAHESHLS